MIRAGSRGLGLALVLVALQGGAPSGARSAPGAGPVFEITTTWSGEAEPTAMWIEQGPSRVNLTLAEGVFKASAPFGSTLLTRRATLVAAYGDELVTLPVRFVPSAPTMRFSIHAARPTSCVDSAIRRLEAPGSAYSAQVQAYFTAKKMAVLTGASACATVTRARVVKAWFDRSYILARDNAHIAIDTDAAAALKAIPAHRAYAERMEREIMTRAAGLDYNATRQMARAGEFAAALATNQALTRSLEADPDLAQAVAEVQRIDGERLSLDRDYLTARVESLDRVPAGPPATAASPPE